MTDLGNLSTENRRYTRDGSYSIPDHEPAYDHFKLVSKLSMVYAA